MNFRQQILTKINAQSNATYILSDHLFIPCPTHVGCKLWIVELRAKMTFFFSGSKIDCFKMQFYHKITNTYSEKCKCSWNQHKNGNRWKEKKATKFNGGKSIYGCRLLWNGKNTYFPAILCPFIFLISSSLNSYKNSAFEKFSRWSQKLLLLLLNRFWKINTHFGLTSKWCGVVYGTLVEDNPILNSWWNEWILMWRKTLGAHFIWHFTTNLSKWKIPCERLKMAVR